MTKYKIFITIFFVAFIPAFAKPNNFITKEQLTSLFQDFKDDLFSRLTLQEKRIRNQTIEVAEELSDRLEEFQENFNDTLDNRFEPVEKLIHTVKEEVNSLEGSLESFE